MYYNHFDSYPEHLGQEIVKAIPSNPEEYKGKFDLSSSLLEILKSIY